MTDVPRPRLEGTIGLPDRRRLGFAEFGPPNGQAIIWLHGTPGARRQVPAEARTKAEVHGLRIIGIDRPGIGSSSPHLYENIASFTRDLEVVADRLGLERFATVGLSGGGPYALAAGANLADRVPVVAVLGGVAPTTGVDAIDGGLVSIAKHVEPFVSRARVPLGMTLAGTVKMAKPLASRALDLYARLAPDGDRRLLGRPEFKAMFLDDILNGSRRQFSAPLADLLLFCRHWGFDAADVTVPVRWWHGDDDNIIPYGHGLHMVDRLPDAQLFTLAGESHLAGMGAASLLLDTILADWDRRPAAPQVEARRLRAVTPGVDAV